MVFTEAYKQGWKHAHEDKMNNRENKSQWFAVEDDYSQGYRDGWRESR